MFSNLLISGSQVSTYIILGVLVVAIIVMFVFSSRRRKKQEEDAKSLIDAVKPGNKVKTIGGICGIVVEVDTEENTFVLETGTEQSGKSFIKFDRQAIYQTDAVVEKNAPVSSEEEVKTEDGGEVKTEAPEEPFADVAPVEEVKTEEKKEEVPEEEVPEKNLQRKKQLKRINIFKNLRID